MVGGRLVWLHPEPFDSKKMPTREVTLERADGGEGGKEEEDGMRSSWLGLVSLSLVIPPALLMDDKKKMEQRPSAVQPSTDEPHVPPES